MRLLPYKINLHSMFVYFLTKLRRLGTIEYYVNEPKGADDFKGVGPFVFASMEQEGLFDLK